VVPYVSTADGDAVPGARQGSEGSANTWLMGSALSAFVLAREAGLKADFPREHGEWEKHPIVLLPSPLTSTGTPFLTHVHSDFYERARKYVAAGGFLYASVAADAAVPDMEALFGASLVDSAIVSEVTLKMVAPLGALKPGDTFRFAVPGANPRYWGSLLEVRSGEVVAVDQDGRPALVTHALGAGKTLLSAYPLETYLAGTPSAFENADKTHLLYEAFREWTGVQSLLRTNHPSVEATALRGASRGYAVLVNHSAERRTVTVAATLPIQGLRQIAPDGARSLALQGSTWQVEIDPYDGIVAEWR
jgi:hypothetical protein